MNMKFDWKFFVFPIIIVVLTSGCAITNPSNKEIYSFQNEKEFVQFVEEYSSNYDFYYSRSTLMSSVMPESASFDSVSVSSQKNSVTTESVDFSHTNNQVENVDEADIIKTDGEYIYTITDNTVFIIKAYPGNDSRIISKLELDHKPSSIFIQGNKLVVFGNFNDRQYFQEKGISPRNGMSYFNIYDISNKENIILKEEFKFEGNYYQARLLQDHVYFITQSGLYFNDYPTPIIIQRDNIESIPVDRIHYFPIRYNNPKLVNIHSINLDDNSLNSESYTVEYDLNLYMNENNMFLTYTNQINEWELERKLVKEDIMPSLTTEDKDLIRKIEKTDSEILSKREKENKIMNIIYSYIDLMSVEEVEEFEDRIDKLLHQKLEEYEYFQHTIINKILTEDGNINYKATGKVPGRVLNQFSMDEYKNVFRIATTVDARWSFKGESSNSTNIVSTLDEDLKILDIEKDIAVSERIYSARFMQDKLYLVTFKQVDPFFVIDLSNPESIEILGELKISGFSRYLHPYDENTIIGIGRDVTETGRVQGLKISLFDVSDFENPKEIATFNAEGKYSSSIAEYEHKAFLFSREKELLVIPAYYNDWNNPSNSYNGAMVFKISRDEISLKGLVDHSTTNYGSLMERSLYIEELLYTKSNNLLRINKIEDLSSVNSIVLKTDYKGDYPVY